jgi:hypothetical protein
MTKYIRLARERGPAQLPVCRQYVQWRIPAAPLLAVYAGFLAPHAGFTTMTLEQLEEQLPNGLHDARIHSITHNYETGTLVVCAEILTGLPSDPPSTRFAYRDAVISFMGVFLCHIEQPENERIIGVKGSVWFKYWRIEPGILLPKLSDRFPKAALAYTLYILDWESSIHIVASDVNFSWAETPQTPV